MLKRSLAATLAVCWCVTALAQETAQEEGPRVNTSEIKPGELGQQADAPAPEAQPAAASPPASRTSSGIVQTTSDRLELDTTVVTGNRELPKVLYIVPWKKADLGELPAQPFNTLLDEVLSPVDRDVFRREVTYYRVVTSSADATQSTSREQR